MSNPQQPELARSRKAPHQDQDAVAGVIDGQRDLETGQPRGPVPPENQPGHRPAQEQDKPDLDAFAAKMGIADPDAVDAGDADKGTDTAQSSDRGSPPATAGAGASRAPTRTIAIVSALVLFVVGFIFTRRRQRSRRH